MKRFLIALALGLALVMGGSHSASAQTTTTTSTTTTTTLVANSAGVSWNVTGYLQNLPGQAQTVPFSCTVTTAATSCQISTASTFGGTGPSGSGPGVGNILFHIAATSTTNLRLTFDPTQVCGATANTCAPLTAGTNAAFVDSTVAACSSQTQTSAVSTTRFYFPCPICFGGTEPLFTISWVAVGNC